MAAERLRLRSEDVTLIVHGVARMTIKAKTNLLRVRVKTNEDKERAHELLCYGLDEIAKMHKVINLSNCRDSSQKSNLRSW